MEKILYHGSEHIIEKPEWGKGALTNDYGRGFCCTEHAELAMEWACAKNVNGYANQYAPDILGKEQYFIFFFCAGFCGKCDFIKAIR